ncbi:MAG: hypothetical protein GC168_18580 [Candidatus Hydrogenedens sp.]|nr:hypothetical protein [Candidatus Hydrogenedens sp.]
MKLTETMLVASGHLPRRGRKPIHRGLALTGLAGLVLAVGVADLGKAAAAAGSGQNKRFNLLEQLRTAPHDGARARMAGLPVRQVTPSEIAAATVNHNLEILQGAETVGAAQAVVTQTDAVFDPTIFASVSYTNQYFVKRDEVIGRFREDPNAAFNETEEERQRRKQEQIDSGDFSGNASQAVVCRVDSDEIEGGGTTVNTGTAQCFQPATFSAQIETAVPDSLGQHIAAGSLGGGIQFIFGGEASLSLTSKWRKPGFAATSGSPGLTSAPFNSGLTYDPYGWNTKLFWTSSVSLAISMPLPYTKGFGREGNTNSFNWKVAQNDEKRAILSDQSQRNRSLSQSLQAYWDLVKAAQNLQTLTELRAVLGDREAGQKRQLESGLTTRYDVSQIESQLASIDATEENTWNQYLVTSNRLLTLIAADRRALLQPAPADLALSGAPVGGPTAPQLAALPSSPIEMPPVAVAAVPPMAGDTAVFDQAVIDHPDVRLAEEGYQLSKVTLAYRENQDLPDLSLSASASEGQSDAVFGYENLGQSLYHLAHPDTANFFIGVRYRYPLWNNATEAALSRARIEERQSFDRVRQTRQRVTTDVDRAIGDLHSAAAVRAQREEDLKLAAFAFERAKEQRDLGLISEFEVLNRYSALLSARLGRTEAIADHEKANIRLLAARGILEQHYVR